MSSLRSSDEVPPLEGAELPPMEAHHANPTTGEDEFALETAGAGAPGNGRGGAKPARARKAPLLLPRSIRPIHRPGARCSGTRSVRAARARNTSTATARLASAKRHL